MILPCSKSGRGRGEEVRLGLKAGHPELERGEEGGSGGRGHAGPGSGCGSDPDPPEALSFFFLAFLWYMGLFLLENFLNGVMFDT